MEAQELYERVVRHHAEVTDTLAQIGQLVENNALDGVTVEELIYAQGHLHKAEKSLGWVGSGA